MCLQDCVLWNPPKRRTSTFWLVRVIAHYHKADLTSTLLDALVVQDVYSVFVCGSRPRGASAYFHLVFVYFIINVFVCSPVPASFFPYQRSVTQWFCSWRWLEETTPAPRDLHPAGKHNRTCSKHNRKCNDLMVMMGIVLVLMETIMVSTGMWWILLVGC